MEMQVVSMKSERLYAITVFLMNHGRTSAKELASRFEVSVRTIQRDIDSLCVAGIPVVAFTGTTGGYELTERFTLCNHVVSQDDYAYILTALNGLSSATGDPKVSNISERIVSFLDKPDIGTILDLSVLQEGNSRFLPALQSAIASKKTVKFSYTNAMGDKRLHTVEPIAVLYRWYSWYLLAYSVAKEDYRTYKLLRMEGLETTENGFSKEHGSPQTILSAHDKQDDRRYTTVTVKCDPELIIKSCEYLKGKVIRYLDDEKAIMELTIVESEQLWLGTMLSFGDKIEVISPEHVKQKLISCAEKVVSMYKTTT